jgi:hypothetical protein
MVTRSFARWEAFQKGIVNMSRTHAKSATVTTKLGMAAQGKWWSIIVRVILQESLRATLDAVLASHPAGWSPGATAT